MNSQESTAVVERLSTLKTVKPLSEVLSKVKPKERFDKVFIVILDSSGSMSDILDSGVRKIDAAWQVFKSELAPNMSSWTYGVLLFRGWDEAWWEIYPCQDTQALKVIRQPSATGGTPIRRALDTAWSWVRINANQARFILLSDGCPTDSTSEELLRMASEHRSIPIDTVGIGRYDPHDRLNMFSYDRDFLVELSNLTGGIFSEVGSVQLLGETIKKLSPHKRPLLGTVNNGQIEL